MITVKPYGKRGAIARHTEGHCHLAQEAHDYERNAKVALESVEAMARMVQKARILKGLL